MKSSFIIKFIETKWYDKDTLVSVQESEYPLKLERLNIENTYRAHTTIYPKVDELRFAQIAIKTNQANASAPYILMPNGMKMSLIAIIDPITEATWWIEPCTWNPKCKAWQSETRRTAGQITFVINASTVKLDVDISKHTTSDLARYLADFKADLWELILDEKSHITGEAKNSQVAAIDEKALALISSILSNAQAIIKKPKVELREIQALKPIKQVRPVPRTFMEICTQGMKKHLTSRGSEPSYNVSENQYVLHVVTQTLYIIKQIVRVSESKKNRFSNTLERLNEHRENLKTHHVVNRDLVVKDLENLKKTFDIDLINRELKEKLHQINAEFHIPLHSLNHGFLRLDSMANSNNSQYRNNEVDRNDLKWWAKIKYRKDNKWSQFKPDGVTIFSPDDAYSDLFCSYTEYEMEAVIPIQCRGKASVLTPEYITKLLVLPESTALRKGREQFQKLRGEGLKLSNNNWIKPLSKNERDEQEKERRAIKQRLAFFKVESQKVSLVHKALEPKIKPFMLLETHWQKKKVTAKSTFPHSMTFVQNPAYQAVHAHFKKLKTHIGLADEDILLALEKIEDIGLINMPILYERWCLLQIIKVLIHAFHYQPEENWKRKLIASIQADNNNTSITFTHSKIGRTVTVSYEPTLDNGKRPDFVLDVLITPKSGESYKKRLVIDAKYYSSEFLASRGGLSGVIKKLYHDKDYSEGKKTRSSYCTPFSIQ